MKILMLGHNVDGRGTILRHHAFAQYLAQWGHEVTLMAGSPEGRWKQIERDGILTILTPRWFSARLHNVGLDFGDQVFRIQYVLKNRFDVVFVSEHRAALPALIARARYGSAYISDWADLWGTGGIADERTGLHRSLNLLDNFFEKRLHRSADAVTAICTDLYHRARILGQSRTTLLPSGADIHAIQPLSRPERYKTQAELGFPTDSKLIMYAGYTPLDIDLILQAFEQVYAAYQNIYLVILGSKVPHLGISGEAQSHVLQPGSFTMPLYGKILACSEIMLLPYRNNSRNRARFPSKIGYYLAAGRPIVGNPTGDIYNLLVNDQVGLAVEETPAAFANAILRLLSNETLSDDLGRTARQIAETKYNWATLSKDLEQVFIQTR